MYKGSKQFNTQKPKEDDQGWVSNTFFKNTSIDGDEHLHGFG